MPTTLHAGVKRPGRTLAVTSAAGLPHPSRLFYVSDRTTGFRSLVNTGAEVSVVRPLHTERLLPRLDLNLQAVNNTAIASYGVRSLTLDLDFGLRRTFRWAFVIADVKQPILGADFLQHFGLLVDVRHNQLSDSATQLKVQGITSHTHTSPGISLLPKDPNNDFLALLSRFPTVTQASFSDCPRKHSVCHHIETTGSPVSSRTCRLAPKWHGKNLNTCWNSE